MIIQCINIRQVPRGLANVNAWKNMFDPYIVISFEIILLIVVFFENGVLLIICNSENMPIQIYWKFYHQKTKISDKKNLIYFFNFCSKHKLWVLVRTASPRRF